ncbi:No apical meristem (NAM) protein [Melia azedarach]|uniref:No apical meristem (NAM) protein n=1 Tax=Melia azedarach TaxID=155640 RepID=A0ACC1X8D9_MELAZ|nr:No apical meristem (NAM) protein [Melia azedarach]
MVRVSSSKAVMMVFVLATFAMAATVSAQSSDLAPAPAPSLDTGAAFSLPISGAFLGSSLILSLVGLLLKN